MIFQTPLPRIPPQRPLDGVDRQDMHGLLRQGMNVDHPPAAPRRRLDLALLDRRRDLPSRPPEQLAALSRDRLRRSRCDHAGSLADIAHGKRRHRLPTPTVTHAHWVPVSP